MTIRAVLIWPDENLCQVSKNATPNTCSMLVEDLIDTMKFKNALGISAPQIGVLQRIIVIDESIIDGASKPLVMINPRILDGIGEKIVNEGCLSLPNTSFFIPRCYMSIVEFEDTDGGKREITLTEMASYAVQHEIDHLDGILTVDRSSRQDRRKVKKQMQKLKKTLQGNETGYAAR